MVIKTRKFNIQHFWQLISLIAVIVVFVNCSTAKKVTKSDLKSDVKTETSVQKQSEEKTDLTSSINSDKKTDEATKKNTSVDEKTAESAKTHTINYDPTTPVDPKTNRRQVASETFQETNTNKAKKAVESTETVYSQAEVNTLFSVYFKISKAKSDSTNNIISKLKIEVSEATTQAGNWWKWLLAGMGITTLIGFAWKFGWYKKLSFLIRIFK